MTNLKSRARITLVAAIGLTLISIIILAFLGSIGLSLLFREPQKYPIAFQSHDVQLMDPAEPSQSLRLHLTLASFIFGAQSNITAFAKLQPTDQNRISNAQQNYTIPDGYSLWFNGSSCPTIPVDLYSPIPLCKIELKRYPQDNADWSSVYWQGNFSRFKDESSYSTIGITYATGGVYSIALSDMPDGSNMSLSEPLIKISDASVTHTFFIGNDANQLGITNFAVSLLVLLVALVPIHLQLFSFLRGKRIFDNPNKESQ